MFVIKCEGGYATSINGLTYLVDSDSADVFSSQQDAHNYADSLFISDYDVEKVLPSVVSCVSF